MSNVSNININMEKEIFNPTFFPFLEAQERLQVFFGGASSGKSFFVVGQRTVYDLLKGGRNYLILRQVARTARHSTFNETRKCIRAWGLAGYFKINKAAMTITCQNGYQAIFGGIDDVEKIKSLTPVKGVLTDIVVEEATETKKDDVKQLMKRLRGLTEHKKRLVLLFNPILKIHWIWETLFKNRFSDHDKTYRDSNLLINHFTYKDNLFLTSDDRKALRDETDKYFYDVYTLGKWGVLGDAIYTNWSVSDLSGGMFRHIRHGLDFGYASHPSAYVRSSYDGDKKTIYILESWYRYGATNPILADELKPEVKDDILVCDSAEPKSIEELNNLGLNAVKAIKGPGSIKFRIQWLKQHHIIIDTKCIEAQNEVQLHHWKKDKWGQSLPVPADKDNHILDALWYSLESDAYEADDEIIEGAESFIAAAQATW